MAVGQGQLQAILKGIGAPVTKQNLARLSAWQRAEGGSASFNPFNTTQQAAGASSYNSVGVRNYTSNQQGTQATIQTLKNGRYGAILKVLRSNKGDFASAVGNSPWGTSGSLLHDILGGPYNPTAPSGGGPKGAKDSFLHGAVHAGGGKVFDAQTFRKQAGAMMLQEATARANGQDPSIDPQTGQQLPSLMERMQALREANTTTVQSLAGQAHGGPKMGGPGSPPVGGSGAGAALVRAASKQLGQPYVWGGESRKEGGFDCSGLVQWAASSLGIHLPRVTTDLMKTGRRVPLNKMKPGDILVNDHHVVIYAGNGRVIAAPHTGTNVQWQPASYFTGGDYQARRVVG